MIKYILFLCFSLTALANQPIGIFSQLVANNGGICFDSSTCNQYIVNTSNSMFFNTPAGNGFTFQLGGSSKWGFNSTGNLEIVAGDVVMDLLGKSIKIAEGTNGCSGQATLASGTVTVSTTCTPSTSDGIFVGDAGGGVLANIGSVSVGTVTATTSFVINSSNALDSSNVNWVVIKH